VKQKLPQMLAQDFADRYFGARGNCIRDYVDTCLVRWLRDTQTIDEVCDLATAWDTCPRGDWLAWIVYKLHDRYREYHPVMVACEKTIAALPSSLTRDPFWLFHTTPNKVQRKKLLDYAKAIRAAYENPWR
jgi:hypothetical protein